MKTRMIPILAVAALLLTTGCSVMDGSHMGVVPPQGLIFSSYSAPMAPMPDETGLLGTRTPGMKVGLASAKCFTWPWPQLSFGWGDCSLDTAAKEADITEIQYADYHMLSVLGIWQCATARAYGN